MPTLEEVILLCEQSPSMLLIIELKAPRSQKWRIKYDS